MRAAPGESMWDHIQRLNQGAAQLAEAQTLQQDAFRIERSLASGDGATEGRMGTGATFPSGPSFVPLIAPDRGVERLPRPSSAGSASCTYRGRPSYGHSRCRGHTYSQPLSLLPPW